MTNHPPQPTDEWEFLRNDDEPEFDLEANLAVAAEDAAMHIEAAQTLRPYSEQTTGGAGSAGDPGAPVSYFDDEEPDEPATVTSPTAEGPEPDLEDLLESQHYAFSPDPDDAM